MMIIIASIQLTDIVIMGIILIGIIGYGIDILMRRAEKILVPWKGRSDPKESAFLKSGRGSPLARFLL